MFRDIVFPSKNEDEFIDMAMKLGYESICFCYKPKDIVNYESDKIKIIVAAIIEKYDDIKKSKEADLLMTSSENRKLMEKVDFVYDLETSDKGDHMHYRQGGLSQINAKIMKGVGLSFANLLDDKERPKRMGRFIQNIKICRKYKLKTYIGSFAKEPYEMRAAKDLISLFFTFGMHPKKAKDSLMYT